MSNQPVQYQPVYAQTYAHQPEQDKFPTWAIVFIALGISAILALCGAFTLTSIARIVWEDSIGSVVTELGIQRGPVARDDLIAEMTAMEFDPEALNSVVGEYEVSAHYNLEGNVFERDYFDAAYTFNTDGTFRIVHNMDCGCLFEGTFVVERIAFNEFPPEYRRYMKNLGERADSDWYRLILESYDFNLYTAYERFLSRENTGDIFMYIPTLGRSEVLSQAQ